MLAVILNRYSISTLNYVSVSLSLSLSLSLALSLCGVFSCRCVCAQLRAAMEEGLVNQKAALQFMGQRFRLKAELPDWVSDEIIMKELLRYEIHQCMKGCSALLILVFLLCRELVLVHLDRNTDKFNMLM